MLLIAVDKMSNMKLSDFEKTLVLTISISFILFVPVIFHFDAPRDLNAPHLTTTYPGYPDNYNISIDFITVPKNWPILIDANGVEKCGLFYNATVHQRDAEELVQCPLVDAAKTASQLEDLVSEVVQIEKDVCLAIEEQMCTLNETLSVDSEVIGLSHEDLECEYPFTITVAFTVGASGVAAFTATQIYDLFYVFPENPN